jgi:hypothetical protein
MKEFDMMKTMTTKLSLIFLVFLIACAPVTSQVSTPTVDIPPSATIEPTPTSTVVPTPAFSILQLESASKLPLPAYKQECVNILPTRKRTIQDFSASGVAVFDDTTQAREGEIILYDLKSGEKRVAPGSPDPNLYTDTLKVSPDHKWLFYVTRIDGHSTFVLSNSAGEIVNTIPLSVVEENFSKYYEYEHEWLGNDVLRLWIRKNYKDDKLIVTLLDPFTKQVTTLKSNFDGLQSTIVKPGSGIGPADEYLNWGIDSLGIILAHVQGANVAYSPDRKLAFFPHKDGYDVLYDLENNREIARLVIPKWGELPKWSTKGEYISIIANSPGTSPDSGKQDFYLLSRDGKTLKRLTYLSEQFDRVSIKDYAWSPDDTKIAFRVNTNIPVSDKAIVPYDLAVVDVTNGNITNYCIPYVSHLNNREEFNPYALKPIWSPDGSQLLVPGRTPANVPGPFYDYDVRTVLLDPSKVSAVEILDSVLVHGWMTSDQ